METNKQEEDLRFRVSSVQSENLLGQQQQQQLTQTQLHQASQEQIENKINNNNSLPPVLHHSKLKVTKEEKVSMEKLFQQFDQLSQARKKKIKNNNNNNSNHSDNLPHLTPNNSHPPQEDLNSTKTFSNNNNNYNNTANTPFQDYNSNNNQNTQNNDKNARFVAAFDQNDFNTFHNNPSQHKHSKHSKDKKNIILYPNILTPENMQQFEPQHAFIPQNNNNEDLSMILPEANSSINSDNNNQNNINNMNILLPFRNNNNNIFDITHSECNVQSPDMNNTYLNNNNILTFEDQIEQIKNQIKGISPATTEDKLIKIVINSDNKKSSKSKTHQHGQNNKNKVQTQKYQQQEQKLQQLEQQQQHLKQQQLQQQEQLELQQHQIELTEQGHGQQQQQYIEDPKENIKNLHGKSLLKQHQRDIITEEYKNRIEEERLEKLKQELARITSAQSEYRHQSDDIIGKSEERLNHFELEFIKLNEAYLAYRKETEAALIIKEDAIMKLKLQLNERKPLISGDGGSRQKGDIKQYSQQNSIFGVQELVVKKRLQWDEDEIKDDNGNIDDNINNREIHLDGCSITGQCFTEGELAQIKEIEHIFEEVSKENQAIRELRAKYQAILRELLNKIEDYKYRQEVLQGELSALKEQCKRLKQDNIKISSEYQKHLLKWKQRKLNLNEDQGELTNCQGIEQNNFTSQFQQMLTNPKQNSLNKSLLESESEVESLQEQIDSFLGIIGSLDSQLGELKRANETQSAQFTLVLDRFDAFILEIARRGGRQYKQQQHKSSLSYYEGNGSNEGVFEMDRVCGLLSEVIVAVSEKSLLQRYQNLKMEVLGIKDQMQQKEQLQNQQIRNKDKGINEERDKDILEGNNSNSCEGVEEDDNEDYDQDEIEDTKSSLRMQLRQCKQEKAKLLEERMRDSRSMKESEQRMELLRQKLEQKISILKEKDRHFLDMMRHLIPQLDLTQTENIDYFQLRNLIIQQVQQDINQNQSSIINKNINNLQSSSNLNNTSSTFQHTALEKQLQELSQSMACVKELSVSTNQFLQNTTSINYPGFSVATERSSFQYSPRENNNNNQRNKKISTLSSVGMMYPQHSSNQSNSNIQNINQISAISQNPNGSQSGFPVIPILPFEANNKGFYLSENNNNNNNLKYHQRHRTTNDGVQLQQHGGFVRQSGVNASSSFFTNQLNNSIGQFYDNQAVKCFEEDNSLDNEGDYQDEQDDDVNDVLKPDELILTNRSQRNQNQQEWYNNKINKENQQIQKLQQEQIFMAKQSKNGGQVQEQVHNNQQEQVSQEQLNNDEKGDNQTANQMDSIYEGLLEELRRSLKLICQLNDRNKLEDCGDGFFIEIQEALVDMKVREKLMQKYEKLDEIQDVIQEKEKIHQIWEENQKEKGQLIAMRQEVKEMEIKLKAEKEQLENMKKDIDNAKEGLDRREGEIDRKSQVLSQINQEIQDEKQRVECMREDILKRTGKVEEKEVEIERRNQEIEEIKQKLLMEKEKERKITQRIEKVVSFMGGVVVLNGEQQYKELKQGQKQNEQFEIIDRFQDYFKQQKDKSDNILKQKDESVSKLQRALELKDEQILGKDEVISQKERLILEKDNMIKDKDSIIQEKDSGYNLQSQRITKVIQENEIALNDKIELVKEKETECQNYKAQILEKTLNIQEKDSTIEHQKIVIEQCQEMIKNQETQLSSLRQSQHTQADIIKSLGQTDSHRKVLAQEIQSRDEKINQVQKQVMENDMKIREQQQRILELEGIKGKDEQIIKELENEIEKNKKINQELEKVVKENQEIIQGYENKLKLLNSQINDELKRKIEELEKEIEGKNREIDGLRRKISENEEQIKNKDNRIEEIEVMIRQQEVLIGQEQRLGKEKDLELEEMKKIISNSKDGEIVQNEKIKGLEEKLEKKNEQIEFMRRQQLDNEIVSREKAENMVQQVGNVQMVLQSKEEMVQKLQQITFSLEQELSLKVVEINGLKKEIGDLIDQIDAQKVLLAEKIEENKLILEDKENKRIVELENFKKEQLQAQEGHQQVMIKNIKELDEHMNDWITTINDGFNDIHKLDIGNIQITLNSIKETIESRDLKGQQVLEDKLVEMKKKKKDSKEQWIQLREQRIREESAKEILETQLKESQQIIKEHEMKIQDYQNELIVKESALKEQQQLYERNAVSVSSSGSNGKKNYVKMEEYESIQKKLEVKEKEIIELENDKVKYQQGYQQIQLELVGQQEVNLKQRSNVAIAQEQNEQLTQTNHGLVSQINQLKMQNQELEQQISKFVCQVDKLKEDIVRLEEKNVKDKEIMQDGFEKEKKQIQKVLKEQQELAEQGLKKDMGDMERLKDLEIAKMKEELVSQNDKIEEKNQEINRLNQEIMKTKEDMDNDVKEQIGQMEKKAEILLKQLEEANGKYTELVEATGQERRKLEEQIEVMESHHKEEMQNKLKKLEADNLEDSARNMQELKETYEAEKQELITLKDTQKLAAIQEMEAEKIAVIVENQEQMEKINKEKQDVIDEKERLMREIIKIESVNKELEGDKQRLIKENEEIVVKQKELIDQLENLKEELMQVKKQLTDSMQKYEDQEKELISERQQHKEVKGRVQQLEKQLSQGIEENIDKTKKTVEIQESVERISRELEKAQVECKSLERQNEELRKGNEVKQQEQAEEIAKLQAKRVKTKGEIQQLSSQNQSFQSQIISLLSEKQEILGQRDIAQQKVKEITQFREQEQIQLKESKEGIVLLNEKLSSMENQLIEVKKIIEEQEKQLGVVQQEKDCFQRIIEELNVEKEKILGDNKKLIEVEKETYNEKISSMENKLTLLSNEKEKLLEQLAEQIKENEQITEKLKVKDQEIKQAVEEVTKLKVQNEQLNVAMKDHGNLVKELSENQVRQQMEESEKIKIQSLVQQLEQQKQSEIDLIKQQHLEQEQQLRIQTSQEMASLEGIISTQRLALNSLQEQNAKAILAANIEHQGIKEQLDIQINELKQEIMCLKEQYSNNAAQMKEQLREQLQKLRNQEDNERQMKNEHQEMLLSINETHANELKRLRENELQIVKQLEGQITEQQELRLQDSNLRIQLETKNKENEKKLLEVSSLLSANQQDVIQQHAESTIKLTKLQNDIIQANERIQDLLKKTGKYAKHNFNRVKKLGLLGIDFLDTFLTVYSLLIRTHPSHDVQQLFNTSNYNHIVVAFKNTKQTIVSKGESSAASLMTMVEQHKKTHILDVPQLDSILDQFSSDLISIQSVFKKFESFHDNVKLLLPAN